MLQTISQINPNDRVQTVMKTTLHVLLIENDRQLAQLIAQELSCEGYQVSLTGDGFSGLLAARQTNPHLIIVGWTLPGISCIEFCRRLRLTYNDVPILVLTHEGQVSERVMGLDAGASDCLSKPFAMEELLARVRAHLRQGTKATHLLQFEQLVLDRQARQVYYRHQEIELTAKEFNLLAYFMRHPNQVLTRDQMLDAVWGDENFVSSNVVEVYVRYLRIKLAAQGATPFIHTVRGVGYVLRSQQQQQLTVFSGLDQHPYPPLKESPLPQRAESIKAS
ncbi:MULTISPECIES: response regulator transcription factor [Cyanophyceae]|uniref:response regulator transcription factor n=1 Tax=Cyanophyceae TaxID=3028117 RepID=UPI0024117684|nr:response regulator transcription factor [Phormidium sp. FACHB-592]